MSQIKAAWVWPSVVLMSGFLMLSVADTLFPRRTLAGFKWGILTAFFGLTAAGLFNYLKNSRFISDAHLYTAVSIYLLIGMQWFALYSAIDVFRPGSFLHSASVATDRQTELLYFSLVTLSTIGYGDIVPLHGEVRMLAALEGITGVLYIAITVALLVSAYKSQSSSN
jgi:ion channel